MPSNLVKTKADEQNWIKAKAKAKAEGKGKDFAYITSIFESMSHKARAPSAKTDARDTWAAIREKRGKKK